MTAGVTHSTVVVVADDGTSPVGTDEWNAGHTLSNVAASDGTLAQFAATTSLELKGVITDETGSGALVFATSPTLVTPTLGVASATSVNKVALTAPATGSTLTIADGKTLTVTADATISGTPLANPMTTGGDIIYGGASGVATRLANGTVGQALLSAGTTAPPAWTTLPGGGDALTSNPLSQFAATTSLQLKGVISDETGSGLLVFATSPTLTTPILGTPTSGTLTNCTGLPVAGIVASTSTALGVGSIELGAASDTTIARSGAGAITVEGVQVLLSGAALGTPSSGTLTNCTGLPLSTGVTGVLPALINAQTGTTYTVVAGDQGKLVTLSNGSAVAVTLPQATGSFTTGWSVGFLNLGAGLVTITPTTSTWNGAATVKLATGQGGSATSDGANYQGAIYQIANGLRSATTIVDASAATAPSSGQVLTATSSTAATWQTPGAGSATPGLIIGCQPIWTSTTQLSIGSGQLYIESTNTIIAVAAQTITPSSPSTNTWYYLYVNNSGTLSASTTAPVAFATACGFARSKGSDTANRYVYAARTDGSSHFYQFDCTQGGLFKWKKQLPNAAPFRTLSNGSATSSTNVDCSAVVPTGVSSIYAEPSQGNAGVYAFFAPGDVTVTTSLYESILVQAPVANPAAMLGFFTCDSSQTLNYLNNTTGGATSFDVLGFELQR